MEEYKSNSHKSRELEEKKIEKVITGKVKTKKKSEIQKIVSLFVSDDVTDIKDYILHDVIIPEVKKSILDILGMIFGERGGRRSTSATKVSYGKYYDKSSGTKGYSSVRSRNDFDYEEVICETRGDAESLIDTMNDIIEQFGSVSVGDMYDLADISTTNFTVNKYGWDDISGAKAVRTVEGYVIKLPKAKYLD